MTVAVTWWGHATTTIELEGVRVLTDPVLTRRIAHLLRIGGPLPSTEALAADVVVISHLHHDHLHLPSLRLLDRSTRIVAPVGTAGALRRSDPSLAVRVEEVDVGDVVEVGGVRVLAVPAHHEGKRSPVSRHEGPALGFLMSTADVAVWFAGDTGLFDTLADIGPADVAVVPVGGWGPTLGETHLDPAQAAEAVRRVGATDAVPIHYGTFWPMGLREAWPKGIARHFSSPGNVFADELARACPDASAHVLLHGQTVTIG
ncbi:MBL fold metallo-hydrolase [Acidothermaceae bacterium B102]|nr:MBL fold metallo-hydrolase [Acidothermaceae bacterium B102]